ncbi:MAG: hypothetical protein JRD89_09345 [Deltaproteobacteria bacterium]|nr:hypothetical protein [Deltaproteobacteria bacterium]
MRARYNERKLRILQLLSESLGLTYGEIERAMGVRVNSTMARLVRQGLVRPGVRILEVSGGRGDPPRWVRVYEITEKGLSRLRVLIQNYP